LPQWHVRHCTFAPLTEEDPVVRILIDRLRFCVLATVACTAVAFADLPAARADYVSQSVTLDQSNSLPDGVTYGTVKIETYDGKGPGGGGLLAGQARLTFSAVVAGNYSGVTKSFGIDEVGFNTTLSFSAAQISGPGGWNLASNKNLDGFGRFNWAWSGSAKGGVRPNPVTVLITGLGSKVSPSSFLVGSVGNGSQPPPQGSVDFAMRVAGFEAKGADDDGQFVGGPGGGGDPPPPGGSGEVAPSPEPSTILLSAVAAGCLLLGRGWQARRGKRNQA
jgi:hypothetical protein